MSSTSQRIVRNPGGQPAPLSFGQERLFLLDRIMPGIPAYNVPRLVRVAATLDDHLLQQALDAIVARHEILRTTIRLEDGEPLQEVSPTGRVALTVLDLRETGSGADEAKARELLARLACRAFDLSQDILLRAGVVHLADGEDLLLLVNHHIGSDHASGEILFAELDELYRSFRDGVAAELPELPVQYADFARWQREHLAADPLNELATFWRDRLAGAPGRLELPADRPRPAVQSYRGELFEFAFDPGLAEGIRSLARGQASSVYMVLVAAFKTLIHRYTGAEDVVIGSPASGRLEEEIEHLLGFFSNTLVLRTDLSGDPTFAELVARVKETTLEARVYQELPFEKLVELLNPERTPAYSPLFQVLLGFDVAPKTVPTIAGAALEELPTPGWEFARLDLSLIMRERADGSLGGSIEYATDLFDRSTIARLVSHLQTLLEAAVSDPGVRLSELKLLSAGELQQLLVEWNDTATPYERRALHDLFGEQARRRRDAVAVVAADDLLSFGELDRLSNRVAHQLRAAGVGAGSLVAICMERSTDLVVAMLGALKTGAAYVPVDPAYPRHRREFILADAQVRVVLTQAELVTELESAAPIVMVVDRSLSDPGASHLDDAILDASFDPDALAYVIYTSGSTGKPKGVEVTHGSVANLLAQMRRAPGIDEHDVVANLTTPAFDLSVPDWYLPLTTGAKLVIVSQEATLDAVRLGEELSRCGATFVQATPTTWQLLLDSDWAGNPGLKVLAGGEALPRRLADDLRALGAVWHAYGPTETTVWSSLLELGPGEGPTPIGGPIANTALYVLDQHRRPVPVGVPGELYIGGDGLARGYHGRPDLTAERFVEDAPALPGAGRLYRTGDLLRWRPGGTLEFLGRIDQQVKLRGFRIELGEIEAVLAEHPGVAAAAVVVREDVPGDRRLVAYVVGSDEAEPGSDELRDLVRSRLPQYMTPSAIVSLATLPVSANGKLDRAALPAPEAGRRALESDYRPAETPIEELLASIWSEVLRVERVGVDDDFFDLGGHSLLAVKMTARVHAELGIDLPLSEAFARPTIRELAASLARTFTNEAADDELDALLLEVQAEGA
jgi:amino acid adenylation domain-containing protein